MTYAILSNDHKFGTIKGLRIENPEIDSDGDLVIPASRRNEMAEYSSYAYADQNQFTLYEHGQQNKIFVTSFAEVELNSAQALTEYLNGLTDDQRAQAIIRTEG